MIRFNVRKMCIILRSAYSLIQKKKPRELKKFKPIYEYVLDIFLKNALICQT